MAALDLDVLRHRALLFETALPSDDAIGAGINRCARHRRRALHGLATRPGIDLASAQGLIESPGVARFRLVGEWTAEVDHLSHQRRRPPRQLARKDTAEAPSN